MACQGDIETYVRLHEAVDHALTEARATHPDEEPGEVVICAADCRCPHGAVEGVFRPQASCDTCIRVRAETGVTVEDVLRLWGAYE